MATLDTIKTALRISHSELDSEITRLISAASADMIRVGVAPEIVQTGGQLVTQATVTYCLMNMTEESVLIDKYARAYEIQIDGIRRATNVQ